MRCAGGVSNEEETGGSRMLPPPVGRKPPLVAVVVATEAVRVTRQPDVVGKGRVAVAAGDVVGHAARPVAIEGLGDGRRQNRLVVDVLRADLEADREARPKEAEAVADQVLRRHAFHARSEGQRQAANSPDGLGDAGLHQVLVGDRGVLRQGRRIGHRRRRAQDVIGVLRRGDVVAVEVALRRVGRCRGSSARPSDAIAAGAGLDGVVVGNRRCPLAVHRIDDVLHVVLAGRETVARENWTLPRSVSCCGLKSQPCASKPESPTPCAVVVYGELSEFRLASSIGASTEKLEPGRGLVGHRDQFQVDLVHHLGAVLDAIGLLRVADEVAEGGTDGGSRRKRRTHPASCSRRPRRDPSGSPVEQGDDAALGARR